MELPPHEINQQDDLFDSPDPRDRQVIDLDTFNLLDEEGREQCIYDKDGYRIPRRDAIIDESEETAAMLFDLPALDRLFEREDHEGESNPRLYLYPIGCLRNVGQFQAHALFNAFEPLLRKLNHRLTQEDNDDDNDDDDDDEEHLLAPGSRSIVRGSYSQGYNAYTHRVRSGARFHDAQKGMITAAFAGTHVTGGSNLTKANVMWDLCKTSLPFDRYHEKITDTHMDESLRLENLYTIDVNKLQRDQRRGR